ncbi:MAG: hypothetical protein R3E02_05960 [Blastomonas sp.]
MLLSAVSALVLMMQGGTVADVITDYSNCLVEVTNADLDKELSGVDHAKALQDSCPDEKQAYWDSTVRDEMGFGSSRAEAEQFATDEVAAMIETYNAQYGDLKSRNVRLVKKGD